MLRELHCEVIDDRPANTIKLRLVQWADGNKHMAVEVSVTEADIARIESACDEALLLSRFDPDAQYHCVYCGRPATTKFRGLPICERQNDGENCEGDSDA